MRKLLGSLVVALMAFTGPAGGSASQALVGIGTMAPGSLSYGTGSAIAELMVEDLDVEARVQPSSGESTLLALLDSGELDFAIANALEAAEAYAGSGVFADRPLESLRIAAALYPLRVGLFVRADSDIETMRDLAGKRVTATFSASAAIATLLDAALAGGGLSIDDITPVPVSSIVAGAEQFVDGRVDAFFFAVGAAKVAEVDASVKLRLLPLDDSEETRERVRAVFAEAYIAPVPPAAGLAGVSGPASVLAFDNLLMTSTAVTHELVDSVVAGIAKHPEQLAASFPPFRGLSTDRLVKQGLRVPYHRAVIAWAER